MQPWNSPSEWRSDNLWDLYARAVYSAPMGRMIKADDAREHYGWRWSKALSDNVWGEIGTEVTAAEVAAIQERERYRVEHRDADDPILALIEEEAKGLPDPLSERDVPSVYVVALWTTFRREVGFFTTYDQALNAAHKDALILKVPATGHDDFESAKMLRGMFPAGWGYASGYAPSQADISPSMGQ